MQARSRQWLRVALLALALLALSQAARGNNLPGVAPLFSDGGEVAPAASDVPVDGYLDLQHAQNLNSLRQMAQQCQRMPKTAGPQAAQGTWVLGLLYLHGKGVVADPSGASTHFDMAWRCGYAPASAGLAWCAIDGCGKGLSTDEALRWIDRMLRINPGRALYLRWVLHQRLSPLAVKGQVSATHLNGFLLGAQPRQWLQQAVALGDAQAANELGIEAFESDRLQDAFALFEAAAGVSEAARFNLGVAQARQQWMTLTGQSALQSPPHTVASVGQVNDILRLARRYHRGEGVPVNFPEAIRYYRAAAELGSPEARRMLSLIYARLLPDGRIDVEWMTQLARLPLSGVKGEPQRYLKRDPTPVYDFLPVFWRR